jgi:NAD(P)-dependent dehydrogenase (short-subunit alcohol dehydrogenase family)
MQDKVALVTGGLRGLGRAMTLGLAASGYRVAAVGHILNDIADIEDMADSLKLREVILPLAADLRKPNDCDEVIGKMLARFGSVDILVNNAGLTFTYIDPPRFRRGTPQNFWRVSTRLLKMSSLPIFSCRRPDGPPRCAGHAWSRVGSHHQRDNKARYDEPIRHASLWRVEGSTRNGNRSMGQGCRG